MKKALLVLFCGILLLGFSVASIDYMETRKLHLISHSDIRDLGPCRHKDSGTLAVVQRAPDTDQPRAQIMVCNGYYWDVVDTKLGDIPLP